MGNGPFSPNNGKNDIPKKFKPKNGLYEQETKISPVITIVSKSFSCYFFNKETGDMYSFGLNDFGQLGQKENNEEKTGTANKMTLIDFEIKSFSAGEKYFSCIDKQGNWYICGLNSVTNQPYNEERGLKQLMEGVTFKLCLSSDIFCLALSEDGALYVIGRDEFSTFGGEKNMADPVKIETTFGKIKQVWCGRYSVLVLAEDGKFYYTGMDIFGGGKIVEQFVEIRKDINVDTDNLSGIAFEATCVLLLKNTGAIFTVEEEKVQKRPCTGPICCISASITEYLYLDTNGQVFDNDGNKINFPEPISEIVCANEFVMAVSKSTNILYLSSFSIPQKGSFGDYGEASSPLKNVNENFNKFVKVDVPFPVSLVLKK